jgi:hypothetical protein
MEHKTISKRAPAIARQTRQKTGIAPKKQTTDGPLAWLDDFHSKIPAGAWDDVPTDSARNLEHYLYGSPKQKN